MPTYEYACTSCGHQFEIIQSFSDDALTACPECQGPLRKVFGSVGIVFKGSGFYKNDSRGSTSSTTPSTPAAASPSSDSSSSDSSSSESSSVKKSDSTSSGSSTPAASD
ncbi:MAG: FmdB family transcriptional regulator [Actinobacteria bacterium]|uniref:Unannotated protein n=1 Tax=freshwater metagenome TaxID=449393 RepID=A0A6J7Q1G0_9ZZZZ|nr:FmdB family transcriptional regulator [Actinomycetota bacterium]MSX10566.1 FmdB family transcriptional regulator [Actinomycetota bacterium]MSX69087.1 FmdB family transcriptional regulator [Actinomycetota bacterium]